MPHGKVEFFSLSKHEPGPLFHGKIHFFWPDHLEPILAALMRHHHRTSINLEIVSLIYFLFCIPVTVSGRSLNAPTGSTCTVSPFFRFFKTRMKARNAVTVAKPKNITPIMFAPFLVLLIISNVSNDPNDRCNTPSNSSCHFQFQ